MTSAIDPTVPVTGTPTTASVRANFQTAHDEISALQAAGPYAPLASPALTGNPTAPTPAPGDADTSIATTAFVTAAVSPAMGQTNNVGRNLVHNPLFNIAQRGNGPFTTSVVVSLDRFWVGFTGGTMSVSGIALADADRAAIGDEAAAHAVQIVFTGGAAAASYSAFFQNTEDVRRLANKTVTVSFWAKAATGTPKIGVSIDQSFGSGGSPSAYVSGTGKAVTISTTWTRYSLTFTVPSTSGKTVGTNGDSSTPVTLWMSSGTTNNSFAGGIGVQSGTFTLWGVQLEVGSVATPLEKPDPQQDLAKCQRFYQLIGSGGTGITLPSYSSSAGAVASSPIWFPPMRAIPTTSQFVGGFAGMATALTVAGASLQTCGTSVTHSAAGYGQTALSLALSADL